MKSREANGWAVASPRIGALLWAAALSACGGGSGGNSYMAPAPATPILPTLTTTTTIGSTLDPVEGGGNPYGLAIAPVTSGLVTAGDLVICNFNDGATNTQGKGTTVVGLHPVKGSAPYRIAQSATLLGCSSVAVLSDGSIAATANQANLVPLVHANGTIAAPFATDTFKAPWGSTFVPSSMLYGAASLYISNAGDGSIDRIMLDASDNQTSFMEIAKGFSVNGGAPGGISAPAGLTYDSSIDTLYVVDTNQNRVIALGRVSQIGADGVIVNDVAAGATFTGPSAMFAKVIANGAPLNGPISGALLANGDLVVGNTLDANGTNLLVEVSPAKGVVASKNVDTGAAGALFGIATSGSTAASQLIYFNDDNDNTVKVLSK